MLVDAEAADIIVTDAFTGIRNSMLRPSIVTAGLDPDNIPPSARGKIDFDDPHNGAKAWRDIWRSEEHTSELQSLMRISYAVFCLKKKKLIQHQYYSVIFPIHLCILYIT